MGYQFTGFSEWGRGGGETEVQRLSWGGSYLMGVSPLYIIFQSSSFDEYCASYALSFFQLKSLKY